jgi:hypothetical protein
MLIPKWSHTQYGNGESPNVILFLPAIKIEKTQQHFFQNHAAAFVIIPTAAAATAKKRILVMKWANIMQSGFVSHSVVLYTTMEQVFIKGEDNVNDGHNRFLV